MKLFTAEQIKKWDAFTIESEGISSFVLMERAAHTCVEWLVENGLIEKSYQIFCGKGNNGGDGLAIARLLHHKGVPISVYILESEKLGTADFQANLKLLQELKVDIHFIQDSNSLPFIDKSSIIIDTLFGAGLNKSLEGLSATLVNHINHSGAIIVSIDLPSGLYLSQSSKGATVIKANHVLTFQTNKLALLLAENAAYIGEVAILDIGLSKAFYEMEFSPFQTLEQRIVKNFFRPKARFSHKGTFGHALLIGGSYGKIGAVVLATASAARSGCGLITAYIPRCGYTILQTALPEAMVITYNSETHISQIPANLALFSAIGIGPGLGTDSETQSAVIEIITSYKGPLVIDADGLNCLALNKEAIFTLAANTILTPHPKEFERLFGESSNEVERLERALQKAKAHNIIIILKGHHTLIALPDGTAWFNTTGNAGMAKAGSGDVLTGIITSLLAQGYSPSEAAMIGVYLHGLAGDYAAKSLAQESMIASDIIYSLSNAFQQLHQ